jgi:hypothetical protein
MKLEITEVPPEPEVRALRDKVFEQPASDKCWDSVRDKWMTPGGVEFLRTCAAKLDARKATQEVTQ